MIFIFDKETKEFFGMATRVFDNGTWREATLEELYPDADHSKLGFVYVEDSPKYAMNPNGWQLKLDENGEAVGIERKPNLPKIYLTTDAVDTDGDEIPELIADAKSQASIMAEVKNSRGEFITEPLTLNFKTTGGTLSARRVSTQDGRATVNLTSSLETVSVTVEVLAKGVQGCSLLFEFMPPEQ
jgi:hypothetical protein